MDQPDLEPHARTAAIAIAKNLQKAFPVNIPLKDCPVLRHEAAVGTHTQMLLEARQSNKDNLPTPANENEHTK